MTPATYAELVGTNSVSALSSGRRLTCRPAAPTRMKTPPPWVWAGPCACPCARTTRPSERTIFAEANGVSSFPSDRGEGPLCLPAAGRFAVEIPSFFATSDSPRFTKNSAKTLLSIHRFVRSQRNRDGTRRSGTLCPDSVPCQIREGRKAETLPSTRTPTPL